MARSVGAEAGALALRFWLRRGELAIEAKASLQDIVSEADRAVERLIRDRVAATFPEDGFLGEEYGLTEGRSGFAWVVDPIDGTLPYLHGIPNWCVSIAVTQDAETVIGVIEAPTHGERFEARLGGGAMLNGAAICLPAELGVRNAATGVGASHRTDPEWIARITGDLARSGGVFFRNGSGALMLAYVAAGRLAGYLEPHMHAWDCLAGLLLVREAGGRTAPFPKGADILLGGAVLAAAPGAWEDLSRLAGEIDTPR
ncbi:MAG: inositol monophosphatase [Rhodobacteraceae bacterium]|nr:inositol monophosphatase [Paracoccaceae bacterium]